MNKVVLVGRITKDPELKSSTGGVAICSFSVACDRRFHKEGEATADFINCVCFGKTAEFVERYFVKGSRIALDGRIQTRSWEDGGVKRYATEVVAENVEFAQSKNETSFVADTTPAPAPSIDDFIPVEDDDLPF